MLDINLFRVDKGGNPDIVRESQKRRYADVTLVDQVIELDNEWRKLRSRVDFLNKYVNKITKKIPIKIKAKEDQGDESLEIPPHLMGQSATSTGAQDDVMAMYLDALLGDNAKADQELDALKVVQLKKFSKFISEKINAKIEAKMKEIETARDKKLVLIGNIVHESVVVSDNEDNNGVVTLIESQAAKQLEEEQKGLALKNHVDLMEAIGGMHCDRGSATAGNRGYYLTGDLVRLNLALVNYSIDFLSKRGYKAIYPPYFMNQSIMGEVAQLAQFDEELYKVTGEGEDKYLIATSEQPICAFHRNDWLEEQKLPIRYVGYSACFRKEVGSHGRDTLGIFRVHQFEKIEQFCITNPKDTNSWAMMEEMISNSEDFYKSLGLGYRVVNIVSGALNNAAAKKLDLEAWFPGSKAYRELVSCSNCTDYQARRLECRYGTSKQGTEKQYVHMLNATLCATTRVMCCICENYQTKDGIVVPEVLQPYIGGTKFIPFEKKEEAKKQQPKKK